MNMQLNYTISDTDTQGEVTTHEERVTRQELINDLMTMERVHGYVNHSTWCLNGTVELKLIKRFKTWDGRDRTVTVSGTAYKLKS